MSTNTEDWKRITPGILVAPVEHIRKMFDQAVWKCSQVTEKLCFADLHPGAKHADLDPYRSAFTKYRQIIGPTAAQQFDKDYRLGTPPGFFHAFLQAFSAGIRSEVFRVFDDLLKIGIAHSARLSSHPVDWAKTHLILLLDHNQHMARLCDEQDLSKPLNTDQEMEDFIHWRDWRAPKLIIMQPSGNLRYDPSAAWSREDETRSQELLESLSQRFIQFLGFDLEKIAGDAHVELAKTARLTSTDDLRFEEMAIEEARKSIPEDDGPRPKVGAVVVKNGSVLSRAHRGEHPKSHAEYVALEEKLSDDMAAGSTVYTTLEPCTTRKHPKIPCAQRLVERRVDRVVIGMLDPNPDIRGLGVQLLNAAGIETQLFTRELTAQVEEMNREFIRAQKERQARSHFDHDTGAAAAVLERIPEQPAHRFEEIKSTFNGAAYFARGEILSPAGHKLAYVDQNLCYLRLIPRLANPKTLELATLKEVVLAAPLLRDGRYESVLHGLNRHGAIACTLTESRLTASTQLFPNGEIWCVSSSLIRSERDGVPKYVQIPCLSVFVLEQIYYDTARKLTAFAAKHLSLGPPWDLEFGLANINGTYLNWGDDPFAAQVGPIHQAEIAHRSSAEDSKASTVDHLLVSFFSKVFDAVGERRPENLHGFPPNRPTPNRSRL